MVGRLRAAGNRVYLAIAIVALLVLAATEPPPVSRTNSFANGTAVAKWMVGYHRQPEPHRVDDAMAMLSAEGGLKSEHRFMTVAAFLAGVIDRDRDVLGPLVVRTANASFDQQRLLAHAAVLSRRRGDALPAVGAKLPSTKAAIAKLLADGETADTLRRPIGDAAALNLYWAYFAATGGDEALLRIIESVRGTLQDTSLQALMVGHAAKWSLTFNAAKDPRVMDACRGAAAEESALAGALAEVVAAAEAGGTRRLRREWQAAVRGWKSRQEPARELSAAGGKRGA